MANNGRPSDVDTRGVSQEEEVVTEETFGDLLRNEREERELSIRSAAETLEADPEWLLALEQNDFDALPDEATMRACLERYADVLDVDAELMIADYDRERESFLAAQRERAALRAQEEEAARREEEASRRAAEAARQAEQAQPTAPLVIDRIKRSPSPAPPTLASTSTFDTPRPAKRAMPILALAAIALLTIGVVGLIGWKRASEAEVPTAAVPAAETVADSTNSAAVAATIEPTPAARQEPPGVDTEPIEKREEPTAEVERIWASPAGVSPTEAIARSTAEPATKSTPEPPAVDPRPDPSEGSQLSITEHGVGTDVQDRKLIGKSDRFTVGTRVWYWTRVLGGGSGDKIDHVWLRDGVEETRISLRVGAATWRTFSSTSLDREPSSDWAVEARDANDTVLSRVEFSSVR